MANDNGHSFTNAFLLGGLVGFVLGVLAAPRSGEEMRLEISERTRGLREQVNQLAERVYHLLQSTTDTDAGEPSKDA